jgi:hypothetical protein
MIFKQHKDFRIKTLREIQWWAWLAAVLPIAALATIFFIWAYGTDGMFNTAMVVGSSIIVVISAVWWWWALHAISILVKHWNETRDDVGTVVIEVKEIKQLVRDIFAAKKDK